MKKILLTAAMLVSACTVSFNSFGMFKGMVTDTDISPKPTKINLCPGFFDQELTIAYNAIANIQKTKAFEVSCKYNREKNTAMYTTSLDGIKYEIHAQNKACIFACFSGPNNMLIEYHPTVEDENRSLENAIDKLMFPSEPPFRNLMYQAMLIKMKNGGPENTKKITDMYNYIKDIRFKKKIQNNNKFKDLKINIAD